MWIRQDKIAHTSYDTMGHYLYSQMENLDKQYCRYLQYISEPEILQHMCTSDSALHFRMSGITQVNAYNAYSECLY